jgi:microcystin-dependent protein
MKGISTALAGQIYVSDGEGSGTWQDPPDVDPEEIELPVGTVCEFAGASAPDRWLLCYGQAISRSTYSALFAVLSTTYGVGDGSTTFNVPDCRGRAIAGQDDMGGTSADRITTTFNGDTLGVSGGSEGHTLIAAELPALSGTSSTAAAHTHSISNNTNIIRRVAEQNDAFIEFATSETFNDFDMSTSSSGSHSHTVTVNSNTASSHNNVQPSIVLNTIIYTGVL